MPFTVVEVRQELFSVFDSLLTRRDEFLSEYSRAAEPPVRCGESHMSGLTGATLL